MPLFHIAIVLEKPLRLFTSLKKQGDLRPILLMGLHIKEYCTGNGSSCILTKACFEPLPELNTPFRMIASLRRNNGGRCCVRMAFPRPCLSILCLSILCLSILVCSRSSMLELAKFFWLFRKNLSLNLKKTALKKGGFCMV